MADVPSMKLPRVGLALLEGRDDVVGVVERIKRAEEHGVSMVWGTLGPRTPDSLTVLAAAAAMTTSIGLGTAIVPTYPRHPAVVASQALVIAQLAPDRFRLGLGPSHRPMIQRALGIPMGQPLDHLREYVTIVRGLLCEGQIDFDGHYYTVHLPSERQMPVPIYVSALRTGAFHLAGQLADGAISWLCPASYLRDHAVPAMREGALSAGRPLPRLVAHVPVVMTEHREVMLDVARPQVSIYGRLPFYAAMFQNAGYPVGSDGVVADSLLEHLVVFGNEEEVRRRLEALLGDGIDELVLSLNSAEHPADEEMRMFEIIASLNEH